jgi:glutathione S-transferase
MKFYNADLSPNACRVRAVVNELAIKLETVNLDFRKGEHKTAEYLKLNPNGKVPTLVDDDFVLWESRAINAYLASTYGSNRLYPTDPKKRALIDQWSYWSAIHLGPAIQGVAYERVVKPKFGFGATDEAVVQARLKEVGQFMPVLDANLAGKQWVAGELSLADFAIGTLFVYRNAAKIPLGDCKNVGAWIERLEARPSWQKAVAPMLAFASA